MLNTVSLDPELEPEPEPLPYPEPKISKIGTGIAVNHYGSTNYQKFSSPVHANIAADQQTTKQNNKIPTGTLSDQTSQSHNRFCDEKED